MKIENVKVGMSVIWSLNGETDTGIITRIEGVRVLAKWSDGTECLTSAASIEPAQPPLANTKIDVQKYADSYGITLEQAHQEIQPWLFEQGCWWHRGETVVRFRDGKYLYTEENKELTYGADEDTFFKMHNNKEITLQRNVSVSLSIAPSEPSIELDGKQYTKAQLLEALAKLEEK